MTQAFWCLLLLASPARSLASEQCGARVCATSIAAGAVSGSLLQFDQVAIRLERVAQPDDNMSAAPVQFLNQTSPDEPDSAPAWYITMAAGLGAAIFILIVMIALLYGLQVLVGIQRRYQESLLEASEAKKRTAKKQGIGKPGNADSRGRTELNSSEIMAFIDGDQSRLELLLDFGNSEDGEAKASATVQKSLRANKIKLSTTSQGQIVEGLMALANATKAMQTKSSYGCLSPKERIQKVFKDVRSMVSICKLLKIPAHDHEERALTAHQDEAVLAKYDEGAKQAGVKNVKMQSQSALGAYFASDKWVDHAGLLSIAVYSQLCGGVYAFYLAKRFPKMLEFMGTWILVSRGEAMSIIVLTILMVLLMTRNLITWIRTRCSWSAVLQNIVDKHALMHQWCGVMIVLAAALHVLGHLRGSIPAIINEKDVKKINEVFTYGTRIKFNFNTWGGALRCYPAVTGVILILLLICFCCLSNSHVRRLNFELFHYPHLALVVAWCGGLWAHGARQWLGCGVPLGLLAVAPVVAYYFWERMSDIRRGIHPGIHIDKAILKKKSVLLEIETKGSGYAYTTGMYCMVQVPDISRFEWHTFTIASAGGASKVQVLFAVAGDWTTRFKELLEDCQKRNAPYPNLNMRGGYGAPAQGMKNEKHIIMVGAGVGATPFLSFLASICDSAQGGEKSQFNEVESAVFYWMSREPEDFAWVNQYNSVIRDTPSLRDRISVRLALTKSLETTETAECSATEVAMFWMGVQVALTHLNVTMLASELGAPTQFGRPDWNDELSNRYEELKRKGFTEPGKEIKIGVFACGNAFLVQALEEACDAQDIPNKVDFRLFAEQF